MDLASIEAARQLREAIEAGCLPEGTVIYLSVRAPHLTYQQRLLVIDGLRRMGYASRATPPRVLVPPAVGYVARLKSAVLPNPEIALSIPLLAEVLKRDEQRLTEAAHLMAIRQALLILKDAGLVYTSDRKFLRS